MIEQLLPLGTVFKLKDCYDLYMIYGYYVVDEEKNQKYKYLCCLYPYGIDNKNYYVFNDENIDKVLFYGYQTNKLIEFRKKFVEANGKLDNGEDLASILELFAINKKERFDEVDINE